MDKCREEFEKKLKCQDLLSELTFCEKTSSYEGDILPTNLATINGAYWAWVKRQAEMDEQQAKVEELQTLYTQQGINMLKLQKRVDSIREVLDELQEWADVIRKRGQKFRDSNFLASADMMDICIKEIEQALKGEGQ